jgi:hypothetical protein
MGSTVTVDGRYPDISTTFIQSGPVIVSGDIEFPLGSLQNGQLGYPGRIDIWDTQIVITPYYQQSSAFASGLFNGFVFTFFGAPEIVAVTLSDISTLIPVSVNFYGAEIAINYQSLTVYPGSETVLNLVLRDTSETPLPGALGLFATGLAGLGLIARRRKFRATAATRS